MKALGLDTSDLGVAMTTRKILDTAGRVSATIECPQVLTAWERVYRVLRDAFPPEHYHRGRGLKAFAQSGEGVLAHFSDGGTTAGRRADRRRRFALDGAPAMPAGDRAALCRLRRLAGAAGGKRDSRRQSTATCSWLMTFCLPPGEQCLGYPVAGPDNELRAGQRRYNVVWYRPADEATELPRLLTDKNGVTHSISIPPPLIRDEPIAAMRAAAERLLAPQFREIVRLIDEPILQPIYDLESPRLAFGRVAHPRRRGLCGAAACRGWRFQGGRRCGGACRGARWRRCRGGVAPLRSARLPDNKKIIERARHLGAYLQATQTAEERARSARHSIPEAVLAETAMIDFYAKREARGQRGVRPASRRA